MFRKGIGTLRNWKRLGGKCHPKGLETEGNPRKCDRGEGVRVPHLFETNHMSARVVGSLRSLLLSLFLKLPDVSPLNIAPRETPKLTFAPKAPKAANLKRRNKPKNGRQSTESPQSSPLQSPTARVPSWPVFLGIDSPFFLSHRSFQ